MGWWNGTSDGASLQPEDTGIVWGDSVADILDTAIGAITQEFLSEVGRRPSRRELRAGMEFALGSYEGPD